MNHSAMQELTTNPKYKNKWDVFINLSADSLPVYKPHILSQYFHVHSCNNKKNGPLHNINFVTSSSCPTGLLPTNINRFPKLWHKSGHYLEKGDFVISMASRHCIHDNNDCKNYNYEEDGNGNYNITLTIHFGSQWMALTPSFVEYIATSMKDVHSIPSQFKRQLIEKERLMADETFIPTLLVNHLNFRETLPIVLKDGTLNSTVEGMLAIR